MKHLSDPKFWMVAASTLASLLAVVLHLSASEAQALHNAICNGAVALSVVVANGMIVAKYLEGQHFLEAAQTTSAPAEEDDPPTPGATTKPIK